MRSLPVLAFGAVVATGLLGACGEAGDPTSDAPTTTSGAAGQVGGTLPQGYDGCEDEAGNQVPAAGIYCESGQTLFTYADRFYAAGGGPISAADGSLQGDAEYQRVLATCRA